MKMPQKIGYLGPAGTFTEAAGIQYNPEGTLVPFSSIPLVAESVRAGETDEGIIPIENSLEGAVTTTLDLLIQEKILFIRHELAIPIEHCLLTSTSWSENSIKIIYSHPQALGQCREFLERRFPEAQIIATLSTVTAGYRSPARCRTLPSQDFRNGSSGLSKQCDTICCAFRQ